MRILKDSAQGLLTSPTSLGHPAFVICGSHVCTGRERKELKCTFKATQCSSDESERCQALESKGWNTAMVPGSKNEAFPPSLSKAPQTSFVHDVF